MDVTGREMIIISLFVSSLVLTTVAIGAAVILMCMYRKLKKARKKIEIRTHADHDSPEKGENDRNIATNRCRSTEEGTFVAGNVYYDNCSPDHVTGHPRYSDNPTFAVTSECAIHSYSSIASSGTMANTGKNNLQPDGAINRTDDEVIKMDSHKINFSRRHSSW